MKIEDYSFGKMKVDGQEFEDDLILDDREGEISIWVREEGHDVFESDLDRLKEKSPKTVIIGIGNSGQMEVSDEAKRFIENKGAKLIIEETPKAVKKYNKTKGSKIGMFHLTC